MLNKAKQALAVQRHDEKNAVAQICELMRVSRPALYKYIDAVKNSYCGGI
ncbi:helix-turn-helix domain-containing protein [Enterobacteriaceae bacterium ESL0689]|nr:helix-turn-helix domain-containing protein [Enterobacteriaceae bacterium ESL0689]